MLEKLDFMMKFWDLKARHGSLGMPLSSVECIELLSLLGLMATDDPLPEAGPPPSPDHALEAEITACGRFVAVEVRMVCASGVVVACLCPLPVGESLVVCLTDHATGVRYTVPCIVEWSFSGAPSAMALRVDGAPSRVSLVVPQGLARGGAMGWALGASVAE